jgi:hypothetical protein
MWYVLCFAAGLVAGIVGTWMAMKNKVVNPPTTP